MAHFSLLESLKLISVISKVLNHDFKSSIFEFRQKIFQIQCKSRKFCEISWKWFIFLPRNLWNSRNLNTFREITFNFKINFFRFFCEMRICVCLCFWRFYWENCENRQKIAKNANLFPLQTFFGKVTLFT